MILFAALGFYTLPTMLFPFGALALWLGVEWLFGKTQPRRDWGFIGHLLIFGVMTALLVILLYVPVMWVSGPEALLNNTFVAPIDPADYGLILSKRLVQTWDVFTNGVPPLITWSLIPAFLIGAFLKPRYPLALLFFSAALVLIRRQAPFDRMWLFMLPVFLIWASAGLVWLFRQIFEGRIPAGAAASLKGVLILLFIGALTLGGAAAFQRASQYTIYAEEVALFLGEYLSPNDRIITIFPIDAPIIYYVRLHGLDDGDTFSQENPERLYVLVNERTGESPENVLAKKNIPADGLMFMLLDSISPVSIYQVEYQH